MSARVTVRTCCTVCWTEAEMVVDAAGLARWNAGEHAQDALPDLTDDQREALISGTCPKCWEALFSRDEEGERHDDETPF